MKKVTLTSLAVALGFFTLSIVSCNSGNSNRKALLSTEWQLERIVDHQREAVISVPDDVYIIFSDSNRVFGNAGCNNFNGHYETEAYNQVGMRQLATTQMWCFNMDFETDYLGRLEKVTSYEATPDKLELVGTGNSFTLEFRPRNNTYARNR